MDDSNSAKPAETGTDAGAAAASDMPAASSIKFSELYKTEWYAGNLLARRSEFPDGITAVSYGIFRDLGKVGEDVVSRGHVVFEGKVYEVMGKLVSSRKTPGDGESLSITWGDSADGDEWPEIR